MTNVFDDGEIVEYEYLWEWQAEKGRTNAEKDRPVCLAMVIRDDEQGLTHLIILPISGTPPRPDQDAMVTPSLELQLHPAVAEGRRHDRA
ncbi:hypothetical protein GGE07_005742 [Sinorhizobium terangae]|uniref:hypothetical protein n=1 Tax=Sinorhizobium terangae TaxID=110322 RepID=UPI00142F159D|nr:hypothetical protein [Sinorhizobium terangae]MBB4189062.1 hypothetical protein [Sinorhizobium terangae]